MLKALRAGLGFRVAMAIAVFAALCLMAPPCVWATWRARVEAVHILCLIMSGLAIIATMIHRGPLTLDPSRHKCTWKGEDVVLTVTEFLLLQALAQRPGHVKNRDQLMDAAYDDNVYVDDRTIDSHIKRLRKKFKMADDDFDAIETLYGVGYRFKESAVADSGSTDSGSSGSAAADSPAKED